MRRPPRIALLIVLLAGLASWIVADFRSQPATTKTVATPVTSSDGTAVQASAETQRGIPARLTLSKIGSDPFSTLSLAPPPKPTIVSAPPVPAMPPLPFRFAGQLHTGSGIQVLFGRGEEIIPVKKGDNIDGLYRVEDVTTTEVTLLHIPSGDRQTMQFNALREEEPATAQAKPPQADEAIASAPDSSSSQSGSTAKLGATEIPAATSSDSRVTDKMVLTRLRWDGPPSARTGASFNVSLRMTSSEHVLSAPMQLRFDPAILEPVSVRPGRYFGAQGTRNFGYRVNPDGSIYIGVSNLAASPASDAEILVLTFKSLRESDAAEISVASLNLQGSAGRAISHDRVVAFRTTIAR